MRIISLSYLKVNEQTENAIFLANVFDLSFLSWYKRQFAKEPLILGQRTCASYWSRYNG